MSKQGIERFLDQERKVIQWPHRMSDKILVLDYLGTKFTTDRSYSEVEVNDVLKAWHTFGDWSLLRRDLCEQGYLKRNKSGSDYQRIAKTFDVEAGPSTNSEVN